MTNQRVFSKRRGMLLTAAHLCWLPAALIAPNVAHAQAASSRISVPAGDLAESLQRIGEASNTRVVFDPDAVHGKQSNAVREARSAREAVLQAVAGLDLAVRADSDGSLVVFRTEAAQAGDIVVTAQRDEAETNYRVNRTSTSDRTGGTLRQLPQNTQVVSDKLMRDQQVQTINEALRNVAGATLSPQGGQGMMGFSVRGFTVSPVTNGIGQTSSGLSASGVQPVSNVERVEVLKGPAAILAGQGNLGGTVNVVTKKPTAKPLLMITGEYQTHDSFRGIIDASNAVTDNKVLSARFIMQAQHADRAPGGYDGKEEYLIAPSLRFKNSATDITIGASASELHGPTGRSTIINTFEDAPIPYGAFYELPDAPLGRPSSGIDVEATRYYIDATQTLTPWLTIAARGEHYKNTVQVKPVSLATALSYDQFLAFNSHALDRIKGNSLDTFARMKFSTGPIKHTLVTGFNYTDLNQVHFDTSSGTMFMFNPLDPSFRVSEPGPLSADFSFTVNYSAKAIYVQDLIEYGPIHLSLGYRKNWYDVGGTTRFPDGSERVSDNNKTSGIPAFGLVVDVTPTISVYGNYTKGYNPTTARAFDGSRLPDLKSSNKEIGLKADLFNDDASLVISLFQTEQDNGLINDPLHPGYSMAIPGGQRGRGIEGTLTGRIAAGLNVNATYSYTKFTYSDPEAAAEAGRLVIEGEPAHSYSVFVSYEPPRSNIGGALGVFGRSSSFVEDIDNGETLIFKVPGGAQLDGNIYFKVAKARLNLGVKNILDKRLYLPTNALTYIPIAEGRTFTATLSYKFF